MPTSVPVPSFTDKGFVAPAEADIYAGVFNDINAAFGGDLDPALSTPQGQLATSIAAIIADENVQFVQMANGVDPSYASGRFQDAIGRIYFLTRIPASSTTVTVTCTGGVGVSIPAGSLIKDQAGIVYASSDAGVIGAGGTVDIVFSAVTTGPIPCPTGFIDSIYKAIPGWDAVDNLTAGVLGRDVESRVDFEYRRAASVAANAQGSLPAVLGAVFGVTGVLDAYAIENVTGVQSGASFTASIAGTTLTVTAVAGGTLKVGYIVTGAGIAQGTVISAFGTGSGGTGNYVVSISQTVGSEAMSANLGGVSLLPHSLYVCVYGGDSTAIANAIWSKKSTGCDYNGSTVVRITDSGNGLYTTPYPFYDVAFQRPTPLAIKFNIVMASGIGVPSNAVTLIKAAIQSAFNGADGGQRARIGGTIYHSRYYAPLFALGAWAQVIEIEVGVVTANLQYVLVGGSQVPTLTDSDIAVSFA